MNSKAIIIGAVVVVVLALGGWFLWSQNTQAPVVQDNTTPSNQTGTINNPDQTNPIPVGGTNHEIIYTDAGFSPSTLTIKVGETVTWKNQSSGPLWTASGMHPTHTVYSGTSLQQHCPDTSETAFDECTTDNPGSSWSFTFNKVGEWSYHNHANASKFGKITVTQ